MMFTALAIMLGHDIIPHHHDFEHNGTGHHHSIHQHNSGSHHHHSDHHHQSDGHQHTDDHHHSDDNHNGNNSDKDDKDKEFDFHHHLFSHFKHGDNGIVFLNSHGFNNLFSKQLNNLVVLFPESFIYQDTPDIVRQNSPPYKTFYYNSQFFLPTGLRAPPLS